jgi:hypothetical protein
MVRTGSFGYTKFGWESGYGQGSAAVNKRFGLQEKVTGWTLNNNIQTLPALNQSVYEKYAYGQQAGSISIGFTLANPYIFGAIYGAPNVTTTGLTSPHNTGYVRYIYGGDSADYAGETTACVQPKVTRPMEINVGFNPIKTDGTEHYEIRKLKGAIINTLGISASVGGLVEVSTDFAYGVEGTPTTGSSAPAGWSTCDTPATYPASSANFPYTFAHARIIWDGTGSDYATKTVASVQDVSIDFATNSELLYAINSNQAVSSFRKIFDITGRFRAPKHDSAKLQTILDQIRQNAGSTYSETIGNTDSSVKLEILFSKKTTTGNPQEDYIKIEGHGLTPTEYSTGLEPAELVFEEIPWRIKFAKVTAFTSETTAAGTVVP